MTRDELFSWRELRLSTYLENTTEPARGLVWSAPNYLLLFSMAAQGLGWCILPSALVEEFAGSGSLVALDIAGWPRVISTDLLWNKRRRRERREAGCVSICRGIGVNSAHYFRIARRPIPCGASVPLAGPILIARGCFSSGR